MVGKALPAMFSFEVTVWDVVVVAVCDRLFLCNLNFCKFSEFVLFAAPQSTFALLHLINHTNRHALTFADNFLELEIRKKNIVRK